MSKPSSSAPQDPGEPRVLSGEVWSDFSRSLAQAGALVTGDDVPGAAANRAEGFQYLAHFLDAGLRLCVTFADADHPQFVRMIEPGMKWGLDCPDCLYLYATVRGDARYRIFGQRGSANHLDIQVNYGHFASGDMASWGTLSSLSGRELVCAADGSLEISVSPERGGAENWLRIEPGAEFVLLRQYFDDWENERSADVGIECLDAEYPAPPPRTDQISERYARLETWLSKGGAFWNNMSRIMLGLAPNSLNIALPEQSDQRAGMAGQAYGIGNFRCAPDEAVIVELTPPACHHWSISLANFHWESLDYTTRQSSLNGHQSVLTPEGVFRGVIAHRDPGVANWLDPAGHAAGSIAARFLLAEAAPKPTLRMVPLAELEQSLPADTPRVTPEQRRAILERRRHAVWRRYRV